MPEASLDHLARPALRVFVDLLVLQVQLDHPAPRGRRVPWDFVERRARRAHLELSVYPVSREVAVEEVHKVQPDL